MRAADRNRSTLAAIFALLLCYASSSAQSTNQDYPTPVTTNEISGTIKPRDVGDSRLTSYFYQFDGSQGDLFINIVTKNFTGDIDVFIQNGLRPLTKIVVYADFAESETGRVIYLRKPEKMMLRVQGRTPGDEVATFRIKFAGSFVASTLAEPAAEPTLPSLTAKNESGIRVNSVGTIVEVIPKATPTPVPVEVARDSSEERKEVSDAENKDTSAEVKTEKAADTPTEAPEKKVAVVVTDNIPEGRAPAVPTLANRGARRNRRTRPPAKPPATKTTDDAKAEVPPIAADSPTTPPARSRRGRRQASTEPKPPPAPDPMEKVNLVILFKDGTTIEKPMSQVLRFTVDKGVLTVIAKDGSIGRYSILDVAKVTIE